MCLISQAALHKYVLAAGLGPSPVLAAALDLIAHPSRNTAQLCTMRRIGKSHICLVDTWEIVT